MSIGAILAYKASIGRLEAYLQASEVTPRETLSNQDLTVVELKSVHIKRVEAGTSATSAAKAQDLAPPRANSESACEYLTRLEQDMPPM